MGHGLGVMKGRTETKSLRYQQNLPMEPADLTVANSRGVSMQNGFFFLLHSISHVATASHE